MRLVFDHKWLTCQRAGIVCLVLRYEFRVKRFGERFSNQIVGSETRETERLALGKQVAEVAANNECGTAGQVLDHDP